jgi:hypothetical protein
MGDLLSSLGDIVQVGGAAVTKPLRLFEDLLHLLFAEQPGFANSPRLNVKPRQRLDLDRYTERPLRVGTNGHLAVVRH